MPFIVSSLEPLRVEWTINKKPEREIFSGSFMFHGCVCRLRLWWTFQCYRYYILTLESNRRWPDSFYTVQAKAYGQDLSTGSTRQRLSSSNRVNLWQCDQNYIVDPWNINVFQFVVCFYDNEEPASSSETHIVQGALLSNILVAEKSDQTPSYLNVAPCLQSLSADFRKLLDNGNSHDVELKCGGLSIPAHRIILCTRSQVFEAMLRSDMAEGRTGSVQIQDMDGEVLQLLIEYIYTGTLSELNVRVAQSLYEAGDKYAIKSLMNLCADFLKENLAPDNACQLLFLSDAHSDREFKEAVIAYILDQKIPLLDDLWLEFSDCHPRLALQVVNRLCKLNVK